MKQEPIKQTMNNRGRVDALAHEVDVHRLSIQSGRFRLSDAKRIVKEKVKVDRTDLHLFNRVVSGLMNGSLTPRDLEKSRN